MADQLKLYKLYDRTINGLLLFTGLLPFANPSNAYRMVTPAHAVPISLVTFGILNFCHHYLGNIALLSKGLGLVFSFLTGTLKTICLTIYRKRLVELHYTLATTFKLDFEDPDLRDFLLSPIKSFNGPTWVLGILTYAVVMLYWLTPIGGVTAEHVRGDVVIKYRLPYPTRYPWTVNPENWTFYAHWAFEIWAGLMLVTFSVIIDAMFGYYIFQISGQLRTLSKRLTSVKSTENYHEVLRECVARHNVLIKCQKHLQCIFGPTVLWLMVTSAIAICALIYQASHTIPSKAILCVVFMIMKSIQILIYGFFGTYLMNENDKLREAIYAADWAGSGEKRFMTDVLIIVSYEPPILKACNLSIISVDMLITVLNTALSYFFMLRTLEEGNQA